MFPDTNQLTIKGKFSSLRSLISATNFSYLISELLNIHQKRPRKLAFLSSSATYARTKPELMIIWFITNLLDILCVHIVRLFLHRSSFCWNIKTRSTLKYRHTRSKSAGNADTFPSQKMLSNMNRKFTTSRKVL